MANQDSYDFDIIEAEHSLLPAQVSQKPTRASHIHKNDRDGADEWKGLLSKNLWSYFQRGMLKSR